MSFLNVNQVNTAGNLPSFTTGANTINFNGSVIGGSSASTMKNRVINGDMRIDQRNNGANTVNGGGTTYFLDRWMTYDASGGSHLAVQQNMNSVTPPPGFTNYLGIKVVSAVSASGTNNFTLTQYIEGYNTSNLAWGSSNAKTVTLSFWVQSSLTGNFAVMMSSENYDAQYVASYTISQANTWTFVSITIPGPTIGAWSTGNSRGIDLRFDLGMGSNFLGTTNNWTSSTIYTFSGATPLVGTLGATLYITGVQLEVGSSATSFDFRHYQQEFALCQRYLTKFTGNDANQGYAGYGSGYTGSTSRSIIFVNLPVAMRTTPTLTKSGANRIIYVSGGAIATTTAGNFGNIQMAVQNGYFTVDVASGTPLTAATIAGFTADNDSNAFLSFSAEL